MPFTSETAVIAARKSHEPTSARFQPPPAMKILAELTQPTDTFAATQLAIARTQIERLNAMVLKESDPMQLDRLTKALSRLREDERQLANRPLPGSLRPRAESNKRSASEVSVSDSAVQDDPQA